MKQRSRLCDEIAGKLFTYGRSDLLNRRNRLNANCPSRVNGIRIAYRGWMSRNSQYGQDNQRLEDEAGCALELAATLLHLETGLRFFDSPAVTFEKLARTPGLGEHRQSSNCLLAGLRIWPIAGFPNHLACYRPVERGIEIVRVLHGARDIDAVLESER
jgi:toxin ParE1/3/4